MAFYSKKEQEEKCLKIALNARKTQHGQSRRILGLLSGEDFPRTSQERPDFVKLSKQDEDYVLVGIEHFRVDQLSLQKQDGRVASTGVRTEKDIHSLFEHRHESVNAGNYSQTEVVSDIAEVIATHIKSKEQSTYNTYIESFKHSLLKHTENIDYYRSELNNLSNGHYPTKLVFLIEIHTELRNLFLNDCSGQRRHTGGIAPFFEDMIALIEEAVDSRKVDYLIFCMGETIFTSNVKVIAVPTHNLRKQLEKRRIKIYNYVGVECFLDAFQPIKKDFEIRPVVTSNNSDTSFRFDISCDTISDQQMLDLTFYAFCHACELKKQGKNIATTCGVQLLLEASEGTNIIWSHPQDSPDTWVIHPKFLGLSGNELQRRFKDFEEKYYPESGDVSPI